MVINESAKICPVHVYQDTFWIPMSSAISYVIGVIVSGWWIQTIWKDVKNPQTFWTIFKIFHAWVKILVGILDMTYIFLFTQYKSIFSLVFICVLLLDLICYKFG